MADSYVVDERVGFAEPANGVELYFCPPQKRTREMLSKNLSSEHVEELNNIDNGRIGVIVWRKAQLTFKKRRERERERERDMSNSFLFRDKYKR